MNTNTKKASRIFELDFIRCVCTLCVILIHTSSTFIFAKSSLSLSGVNAAFFINQISRFAVPLFILLSGISLSEKNVKPLSFFKSRFTKIILPYILWSFVYLASEGSLKMLSNLRSAANIFLLGSSAAHLWFVPVISQLYLLYFILKFFTRKNKTALLIVTFAMSLYCQTGVFLSVFGINILPEFLRAYMWILFPCWIFYFTLGLCITKDYLLKIIDFGKKYLFVFASVSLLLGILITYESVRTSTYSLSIKPLLLPYTVLAAIFLLAAGSVLHKIKIVKYISSGISELSYTIYLCHILFLNFFIKYDIFRKGMLGFALLSFAVIISSILFSVLYNRVIKFIKSRKK